MPSQNIPSKSQSAGHMGTILKADLRSIFAIIAPMLYVWRSPTASSTEEYCSENSSFKMPSLTLDPWGAETLHFPFFLGAAPSPEVLRLDSGRSAKGPRTLPAATSFWSLELTTSGCWKAEGHCVQCKVCGCH